MTEPFNTLEAARKLQEAGCSQKIAEEMASQINGAISGTVATKADIELLQSDIERLEASTKADIEMLRKETKADIELLHQNTKSDIELLRKETKSDIERLEASTKAELNQTIGDLRTELRSEMSNQLRWIVGMTLGSAGLLFAALKLWGN